MEGGITILYINVKNIMYIYKLQYMKKKLFYTYNKVYVDIIVEWYKKYKLLLVL